MGKGNVLGTKARIGGGYEAGIGGGYEAGIGGGYEARIDYEGIIKLPSLLYPAGRYVFRNAL